MKLNLVFILLFGGILLSSCEKGIYTEREKSLFINPIFGQDIVLDSINTLGDLTSYFDRIYCTDKSADKWPILYFDLEKRELINPKQGKNILAMGIEPSPCPDLIFEYDFTLILEIVKDGYNIEVEEERIEPDSLFKYIPLQYLNYGEYSKYSPYPENNGIWLISNKDDKLSNLNKYIAQIIDGFVQMAKQYAQINFGKNLQDLTDEEFAELKKTIAFHLSFKYNDEEVPQATISTE
jgi:hypothetical protein